MLRDIVLRFAEAFWKHLVLESPAHEQRKEMLHNSTSSIKLNQQQHQQQSLGMLQTFLAVPIMKHLFVCYENTHAEPVSTLTNSYFLLLLLLLVVVVVVAVVDA